MQRKLVLMELATNEDGVLDKKESFTSANIWQASNRKLFLRTSVLVPLLKIYLTPRVFIFHIFNNWNSECKWSLSFVQIQEMRILVEIEDPLHWAPLRCMARSASNFSLKVLIFCSETNVYNFLIFREPFSQYLLSLPTEWSIFCFLPLFEFHFLLIIVKHFSLLLHLSRWEV